MAGTRPSFDLQSHSVHSDGELSPAELVTAASTAGVELLALTDHDSVDGVPDARDAAARAGIGFVTGTEISTIDPTSQDLHVLGYLIDETDPALREQLAASRGERENRAQRMIEALSELGFAVDESLLRSRRERGQAIGRPHLAQAVVGHPGNAERLRREQLTDPSAFLVAYLIEGRPAFRPRLAPSAADAIELIHGAGGVAIWAHPFWGTADTEEVL